MGGWVGGWSLSLAWGKASHPRCFWNFCKLLDCSTSSFLVFGFSEAGARDLNYWFGGLRLLEYSTFRFFSFSEVRDQEVEPVRLRSQGRLAQPGRVLRVCLLLGNHFFGLV